MAPPCFYSHVTEIKVTFPEFASGENSVEVSQASLKYVCSDFLEIS